MFCCVPKSFGIAPSGLGWECFGGRLPGWGAPTRTAHKKPQGYRVTSFWGRHPPATLGDVKVPSFWGQSPPASPKEHEGFLFLGSTPAFHPWRTRGFPPFGADTCHPRGAQGSPPFGEAGRGVGDEHLWVHPKNKAGAGTQSLEGFWGRPPNPNGIYLSTKHHSSARPQTPAGFIP